jgi:AraC family transcriptional activator of pobA
MKECTTDDKITDLKQKGFNVHEHPAGGYPPLSFERRDFYKVVLATGDVTIWYGDQTIDINDTFLFFSNPRVPYSVEQRSIQKNSYGCVFNESFIVSRELVEILQNLSLFNYDGVPVVPINKEQSDFIAGIFQRMLTIHLGNYEYKDAILRSCLEVIIHEAVRIQSQTGGKKKNAATRITHSFVELLERQFPIENTEFPLKLRTAQDFAQNLNVHINYMNRAVK